MSYAREPGTIVHLRFRSAGEVDWRALVGAGPNDLITTAHPGVQVVVATSDAYPRVRADDVEPAELGPLDAARPPGSERGR